MTVRARRVACVLFGLLLLAGVRALTDAAPTRVRIEARDRQTGQPIPARFYLTDAKGTPITPTGLVAYHKGSEHHFVAPGPFEAELAPGRYRLVAERGAEYLPASVDLVVQADHLACVRSSASRSSQAAT